MRIIFMGTPDFSVPALRALVSAGHEVACCYTQPPRPAGRGKRDRPSAVHLAAEDLGIEIRHPASLKGEVEQRALAALEAEIAVVVAYGLILPQPVLDAPANGCLNIHASLLPRWRGAAPIHRAVMAGDDKTGVCIMRMEAGLDTGPVILRETLAIGPQDTTGDLHGRLAALGADAIVAALARLGALPEMPQPEIGASYAAKIDKAEARVDWTRPATEVDRLIRGLSPFPGAWCEIAGTRMKLLRSRIGTGQGAPGEVLDGLTVACGDGAVDVTEVQREGRRAQTAEEALRGMDMPRRLD